MVRGQLPKLVRAIIGAQITIDVHARDIVSSMVKNQVDSSNNFEWVKQLRYYWDLELDNCVVRMSTSQYVYGYEYLGASARLVITPLTVIEWKFRCFNVQLNYCISCYFREGFIFASQNLAKISTSIYVYL